MRAAGVELLFDFTKKAYVGFFEGLASYVHIARRFFRFVAEVKRRRPDAAILLDFPEFNMRLIRRLKSFSIPVIYYIVPQVWAWRKHRVHALKKYVDLAIPILPFEERFLRRYGVNAYFLGHPLRDRIMVETRDASVSNSRPKIALLPGSRTKEIKRHMPILEEAASIVSKYIDSEFFIAKAKSVSTEYLGRFSQLPTADAYELFRSADAAVIASGTATLEAALYLLPFVAIYRVLPSTYHLLKMLLNVDRYTLVNIIAEENVVEELMQWRATPRRIAKAILRLLDRERRETIIDKMRLVAERLGPPGTVSRVAEKITDLLKGL